MTDPYIIMAQIGRFKITILTGMQQREEKEYDT